MYMYIFFWFSVCFYIYINTHIYIKVQNFVVFLVICLSLFLRYVLIYLKDVCLLCSVSCIVNAYFLVCL